MGDVQIPASLYKLANKLTETGVSEGERIQVITGAKVCHPLPFLPKQVPIVKYVDTEAGCQIDICFNQTNGPRNSAVIKAFLNDYWELKPIVLVLKYFLLQRDLNETYTGGIGSYALVLLVISFLQVCGLFVLP